MTGTKVWVPRSQRYRQLAYRKTFSRFSALKPDVSHNSRRKIEIAHTFASSIAIRHRTDMPLLKIAHTDLDVSATPHSTSLKLPEILIGLKGQWLVLDAILGNPQRG